MKNKIYADRIVSAVAVVALMVLIFCFSAQNAQSSDNLSGGVIRSVVEFVDRDFDTLPVEQQSKVIASLQFIVRKSAHFSEYALLGFLTANALRTYGIKKRFKYILPPIISMLYATSDEIHQYFVPGRACRALDVLIDTSGAVFGTAIFAGVFWIILKIGRRKNDKKA